MSRFCLRYQAIDLHLAAGELVAGRSTDCDLVLDDSLVSRRHAKFREQDDQIEVEDLGSRNGVLVNDARIAGPTRLSHGDRVQIGSQQLTVKDSELARAQSGTSELSRCAACSECVAADNERCPYCGTELPEMKVVSALPPTAANLPSLRPSGSFAVLAQLAEKALGMGRFDEAERVLTTPLTNTLQGVQGRATTGIEVGKDSLALMTRYALRLADALEKPSWLDYAFELFTAADQLMPAELIDELYRVANKVRYTNPRAIRGYVAMLKSDATSLGPNERFLVQRLEGLERRVVSG